VPAGRWLIELDASGDAYVAVFRAPEQRSPQLLVRLPRRTVEDAVFAAAGLKLEVAPDGRVAAYAESSGARTLVASLLSTLIVEALESAALTPEERPAGLARLEGELMHLVELVRRAQASTSAL
jgi:hypothetical protein